MNSETRLAIAENIFDIEARLQGILFAIFLVMRGLAVGEKGYVTGDVVPYWLFTLTVVLLIFGGGILALALRAVTAKVPPSEGTIWWLIWSFRLKVGIVFFVVPIVTWWLV